MGSLITTVYCLSLWNCARFIFLYKLTIIGFLQPAGTFESPTSYFPIVRTDFSGQVWRGLNIDIPSVWS